MAAPPRHASTTSRPLRLRAVCVAAAVALALAAVPAAWALPDGAVPTQGQATLVHAAPGTLQILQSSTRAGFDWRSFSIAAGERVQVLQPNAQAILFNRVTGADPSLILGQLQSNGRVFLSNPRGIVFGAGSQVDVGGLLATTLTVNTTAGADGRWQLGGGDAAAGVLRADGSIRAPGGTVALVGPQLSVGGHLVAGRLGLAAAGAAQVDVDGDGLIFFNLRDEQLAARLQLLPAASLLARSAELRAAARSQFADTVLNLDGVVRAQGLVQQGGQVVIGGAAPQILVDGGMSGVTRVGGTLDASATSAGATGGQVRVLGERVWLDSTARLDARGDAGGGLVQVGGGWQGQGTAYNALHTRVAAGAQIDASAIRLGDGGQVVVWADDSTVFNGSIRTRGGVLGGDGGAVETSGRLRLGIGSGTVDAGAAPGGRAGRWLLDPLDITVSSTAGNTASDGTEAWNENPGTTLSIKPGALETPAASVLLQATRHIRIESPVTLTAGEAFTAQAGGDITVTTSGSITTVDRDITLAANQVFNSQTPGGPAYGGTPSTATGTGKVVVQGALNAGSAGISISRAGGTGVHQLGSTTGSSLSGASLAVTGPAELLLSVTFDVGSLALPGAVTLTTDTSLTVPLGRSLQITGAIGDGVAPDVAFRLTKLGAGTLSLAGVNSHRGGTLVSGGTLQVAADTALGAGALTLDGGTLATSGVADVALDAGRGVVLAAGGGTLQTSASAGLVVPGVVGGTGALTKTGDGVLTLGGTNTYEGGTTVQGGVLAISANAGLGADGKALALDAGTLRTTGTAAITLDAGRTFTLGAGGGTLDVAAAAPLSVAGALDGSGALTKDGAGTLSLAGSNGAFDGSVSLAAGTLSLSRGTALGAANAVTLSTTAASTLDVQASTTVGALSGGLAGASPLGTVLLADGTTLSVDGGGTLAAQVDGAGRLAKVGTGTLVLSGANSHRGGTVVQGATLQVQTDSQLGNPAGGLTLQDGGTLAWAAGTGPQTSLRAVLLGSGGGTLDVAGGADLALGGALSGSGALTKAGDGRLSLASGNPNFLGSVSLAGGQLSLDHAAALGSGNTVVLSSTAVTTLGVNANITLGALSGGAAGASPFGDVVLALGKTLSTDGQGGTLAAVISGDGALAKVGSGTLVLSGVNLHGGGTEVHGGSLELAAGAALPAGTDVAVTGGVLDLGTQSASIHALSLAGGEVRNGILSATRFDLALGQISADLQGGSGSLHKTGGGAVTLSGSNSYAGSTTVSGGTLTLAGANALPVGTSLLVDGSGSLDLGGSTRSPGLFTLDTSGSVHSGSLQAALLQLRAGTLDASLAGGASLFKQGTGTVSLTQANPLFTGTVTVSDGTLALDVAGALGASNPVTLDGPTAATLAVNTSTTVQALAGGARGAVVIADGATLFNGGVGSQFTSSFAGSISGRGSLVQQGGGSLMLTGSNGFTGGTTVAAGTLVLSGGAALDDAGVLQVAAGATLQLEASETVGPLSGAGTVALGLHTLTVDTPASTRFSGSIGGTGGLVKQGNGSLTLAGANGFTGGTLVQAGTLELEGGAALAAGSALTLAAGSTLELGDSHTLGTLAGNGRVALGAHTLTLDSVTASSFGGSIGGTGRLVKNGGGSLLLSGANGFTGGTTVGAGTLVLAGGAALADGGALALAAGATLQLDASEAVGALSGAGAVVLGAHTLTVDTASASSFGGDIGGSGSLVKQGGGSLALTGNNAVGGGTRVVAGTLLLGSSTALADAAAVQVDTGATLQLQVDKTLGSLAGTGAVALGGHTLTLDSAGVVAFGGGIGGSGGLVKRGTGSLALSGTNLFTGGTAVEAGTLRLAGGAALADSGTLQLAGTGTLQLDTSETVGTLSGAGTVALGPHTLTIQAAADASFGGAIGGAGTVVKRGAGALTLAGINTQQGGTTVAGGALVVDTDARLGAAVAPLVLDGGTLRVDTAQSLVLGASRPVVVGAGGGVLDVATGATLTLPGPVQGVGGLVKQGLGVWSLQGDNRNFTGDIGLQAGSLRVSGGQALPDAGLVQLAAGTSLAVDASETLGRLGGLGDVGLATGSLLRVGTAADASFAGSLSGNGGLVKQGTGTLTLSGAGTQLGGTQVLGGVLVVAADASLGSSTAALTLDGGSLRLAGATRLQLSASRGLVLGAGGGTLDVQSAAGQVEVLGAISGSGTLHKQGAGSLRLAGSSAGYGGEVDLAAGTLRLASGLALPDSTRMALASGSLLQIDSSTQLGLLAGTGSVALGAGSVLTLGTAGDFSFGGSFSGTGGLAKRGSGALTLAGSSSHTGGTRVLQGRLLVSADGQLGAATSAVTLDGGTLATTGSGVVALAAGRSLVLGVGGGTVQTSANAGLTLAGPLAGGGTLTKQGAGTLRLAGNGSGFSGAVVVRSGSLALQGALALGAANALQLDAGSRLDVLQSVTLGSLAGAGDATLAAGATLSTGFASSRFDGGFTGDGALAKQGAGTLTLAGTNLQRGSTTLQAGTLRLLGGQALPDDTPLVLTGGTLQVDASERLGTLSGTGAVALAAGSQLTLGGAASSSFAGSFGGDGGLVKQGAGTLTLTGSSSHGGGTTVAGGVLAVLADAALGAAGSPLTLDGGSLRATGGATVALAPQRSLSVGSVGGTLAVDAGTTLQVQGPLDGSGPVTKAGAGTLALAGANPAFQGAVQVSAGTLALQHAAALGAANPVDLAAGSTLDLGLDVRLGPLSGSGAVQLHGFTLATGGASSVFSGTLDGGGVLQLLGGGQLTLAGATGFTGSTQVLGGTLALADADALTGSAVTVAPGALLAVQSSSRVLSLAQPADLAGDVVLAAGATLSTGGAADTQFAGAITGAGALRKLGSGRFTLTGNNSYSGGTQVEGGTLQGDSRSLQGDIGVATQLVFDQVADGSFAGRLDGAGSLVKQGGGVLQLTGMHQHTGGTAVLAGTLRLAGGQAVPDTGTVALAAGATLQVDASETLARLTGSGLLQLQPGATLTLGDATSFQFDGRLAGSGALVKQGSGQLTLAGDSGHSGSTLVQAGSLALAAAGVLADSTVTLAGQPGVELRLLADARIGALASEAGPATPLVALDGFRLAAGGNGGSTWFAGSTQGSGSLVKQGAGVLMLAGSNAHTGGTQVQAGSLVLQGAQALAAGGAVQVDAGASLALQAAQAIGALSGDGAVQLGAFQLTTGAAADSLFSGTVGGSGGLAKVGAGRLTLAGANTFTGTVDVQAGTLALAGGAALADSVAVQVADTARLVAGTSETVGALGGAGALVLDAGTFTTGGNGSSTVFSGAISGTGRLAKSGSGSLTLAGTNTHTGGLALLGGSLVVAGDSALGAVPDAGHPASLLFDGGTLQAAGSFTIAPGRSLVLQGAGGTLQVDPGQVLNLPATLADGSSAGTLAKTGAGTLALTAAADSTRSGPTQVLAGTLALQRDGQLGTPAGALVLDGGTLQVDQTLRLADARTLQLGAAGGTLLVAGGATLAMGGLIQDATAGGGSLTKTGDGQWLLDGAADNTHTGATLLRGGSLALQRDGQLGAAPTVATPGQLLIDGATLQIDGDTVLAATRGLALGRDGATLQVADGRVAGLAGVLTDAPGDSGGTLAKTGGGLLRLQADLPSSHTGATQVLGGTLALRSDAQLGTAPTTATPGHLLLDGGTLQADAGFTLAATRGLQLGAAGGTVDVAAGQQLAYGGVLSGASPDPAQGALTKVGAGSLALAGANTFAGATRLQGGVLAVAGDAQLGAAPAAATPGHLLIDGGTLQIGASTTLAASRGIALGAQGAVLDVAAGARVVYDGSLADAAGAAGAIDKAGSGALVLGGVSSHSGPTRVLAGTLATQGPQRLPQAGAVQLANQASLVLGGAQTLAALGDAPNPGGAAADGSALVDLGAFTLRLDTGADDGRSFYSGAFTGQGGQLLKQGGGILQLAGSGVGRNLVTVDAGLLVSLGGSSLSTEAEVTVAPGAALRLMAPVTVQSLDLSGRLSGPGALTASNRVDLRDAVVDTGVATALLRSQGSSQVNAAVQADSSMVSAGTLTLGQGGSLQTASLALQGGATLATQEVGQLRGLPAVQVDTGRLDLAGAEQVASLRLAGTLAGPGRLDVAGATWLQGASVQTGLGTDTLRSSGSSRLDAAVVARSSATLADGSLVLGASGSLSTPLLTLDAGTLDTGSGAGLSADSRLVVQRGATLLLGADQRLASLDLAGTLGAAPAAPVPAVADGQQRALADTGAVTGAAQLRVDGAVALDGATVFTPLTAATLTSTGATTLAAPVQAGGGTTVAGGMLTVADSGLLTTPSLQVQAGGVATSGAQRLQADTQVALAAGTTLQLGGDQTLARLADLGAGAAPAQVQLGSFTLAAGADGADAVFSGRFSGDGTLAKQGAGTWLLRSDQAHGDTRIEAGTLQLGDGGASGSLGRGAVVNDGLLRFQRSDAVRLTQDVSGSGGLQQAGSGSLSLASTGLRYTGDTTVSTGSLRTEGADRLPDASHLRLAAGTSLATGGDDRVGALTADGAVSLGGGLASTGHQLYNGPVNVTATAPITLSAPLARIEALHAGNQWGSQPLSVDAGQLLLGAGRSGAAADAPWNNLVLGQVALRGLADGGTAAAASQIDAGTLQIGAPVVAGAAASGDARLDGQLTVHAGSLALRAHAAPVYQVPAPAVGEVAAVDPLRGREIALADDVLWQNTHSQVRTAAGASLSLQSTAGASIRLGQTGNLLEGEVSALSGAAFNTGWTAVDLQAGRQAGQAAITLAGQVVQVGGAGLEADVLRLTVGQLGTAAASPLTARLWYNDASFGQQRSLPGLQITLLPDALATPASLGTADRPVQVNVGGLGTGARTEGLNAGYVQLLPKRAAGGGMAVFLAGPKVGQAAYSFFQDGAGDVAEVPLFYNNVLPATPQLAGSLSAVASVSETARRERFDETVRTENVAIRLRAGVIAEVGPGRPATQGTQGIRLPSSCSTVGNVLGCGGTP